MSANSNSTAMGKLRREMHYAEGRYEAFVFSLKCQANVAAIQAEIEESKQKILDGLRDNPNGSMAEGSTPRVYQDGYISGLVEALEIAKAISNSQP